MALSATVLRLSLLALCLSPFPYPALSAAPTKDIKSWCSQTPYPKDCEHLIGQLPSSWKSPQLKSDFKKLAVVVALDGARRAASHAKQLGSKCHSELEKKAWADCLALYESTILELNRTIEPTQKCDDVDRQTWLSAALTNLDTCQTGFVELGVVDNVLPLIMSNNVSKLIGNTLAINKPPAVEQQYKDGFPKWLSAGDRKLLQASSTRPNLVVAQDGSGDFRTIREAIDAASDRRGSERFVIRVKAGVYSENVEVGNELKNIMLVGDNIRNTIVTGSRSVGRGSTTFNSATFAATGEGFIARDITFRNTAGPQNNQAVALRSGSDLSVFYRCGFEGYQDTLYVHSNRQFYKDCYIYGTVDFIFGNAAAVLQNCMIYARQPMARQKNVVTAQGRTDPNQNTGISIHNSRVMAAPDLVPVQGSFRTFLGRPWKEYSRTVYMKSYIDSLVDPAGWLEWDGSFALSTLYYGEYRNVGPGSSTANRVNWRGYRVITDSSEASQFTVRNFISGASWLPSTGVPYHAGI